MSSINQENLEGDNVGRDKNTNVYNYRAENIYDDLMSKIQEIGGIKNLESEDENIVAEAFKGTIRKLIEREQSKPQNHVTLGKIRHKYEKFLDDEQFNNIMVELRDEKSVVIQESQICYLNPMNSYKIDL